MRRTQKYIILHLGGCELDELTAHIPQNFTAELSNGVLAASTVNGIVTVIKSSIKKAVRVDIYSQRLFSSWICLTGTQLQRYNKK